MSNFAKLNQLAIFIYPTIEVPGFHKQLTFYNQSANLPKGSKHVDTLVQFLSSSPSLQSSWPSHNQFLLIQLSSLHLKLGCRQVVTFVLTHVEQHSSGSFNATKSSEGQCFRGGQRMALQRILLFQHQHRSQELFHVEPGS